MTKTILFEQLPPELFELFNSLTNEIAELRRMIQEGDNGMISEAEFNAVKERLTQAEQGIEGLKQQLMDLNIDPVQLNELMSSVQTMTTDIESLQSYDKNSANVIEALVQRITTIETKHVQLSLRDLTLPSTVTSDITLPESDEYLSVISWASSHPHIISQTGVVKRPTATEGNMTVVLTATATYGSSESSKTFIITVTAADITDGERLDAVANNLDESIFTGSIVGSTVYITENQVLPSSIEGVSITWSSSNLGVITNDGIVTRPVDGDEAVTLTATLAFNSETRTKMFSLIVEKAETAAIDYSTMISDFTVSSTDNTLTVVTTMGTIDTNVLTTEVLDSRVSTTTALEDDAQFSINITFDGTPIGDFSVTGLDLKNGRKLSSIMGEAPTLLANHTSNDVDTWVISFGSLAQNIDIRVELLVDEQTIKEASTLVIGTQPTEPEPEIQS